MTQFLTIYNQVNAAWVGLGFSEDTQMGDDSVIECVKEANLVNAYTSFTTRGIGNYGAHRSRVVWNYFMTLIIYR